MAERSDPKKPAEITFQDALEQCEFMSAERQIIYSLPSLRLLKKMFESGEYQSRGPEWTAEGYVYNHLTGQLITEPQENTAAGFRPIAIKSPFVNLKNDKLPM